MKKLGSLKVKRLVALLLSLACSLCLLFAVGCDGFGGGNESDAKKSIFYAKSDVYTLTEDYSLSEYDETATRGSKGRVRFSYAFTLDLGGKTLDLAGRTMVVSTAKKGALVSFKNGTIKGGKINVSVPNGDVNFDDVTIDKDVTYELEAASQTIRMNNSTLLGSCVIVSNTHVEINRSEVGDVTIEGRGTLNLGTDATLNSLEISKDAAGAKVVVSETAKVTGDLTVGAPSDVVISGSVSKVSVKENLQTGEGENLNVKVEEGASVQKLEINSQASVEVAGTVSHVEVSDEDADVTVSENAIVGKVDLKAPAEVTIQGTVSSVVVQEDAAGATVSVKGNASISNVVVGANDTKITVEETSAVTTVKVVEEVTGTDVPDGLTSETIAKEDAEEYFKHVHNYRLVSKTEPTCEVDGKEVYECVDGDDAFEKVIKALGHNYEYEIVKAPTETEAGEGKYTCTRCGHSYTKELPVSSGEVITVSGLSSLLQSAFGDGLDIDLSGIVTVFTRTEKEYENEVLVSTKKFYYIDYLKRCEIKLDCSNEYTVAGSANILVYSLRTENIEGLDFTAIANEEDVSVQKINLYVSGDGIYIVNEDDGNVGDIVVNLKAMMDYLTNDSSVPTVVRYIAQGVQLLINAGELDIPVGEIQESFEGIVEKLGNIDFTAGGDLLSSVIKGLCDEVKNDNDTVYTLNFEKAKGLINKYAVMTVSELIESLFGEGSVESAVDFLKTVPDLTVNQMVKYLDAQLALYGVEIEDVYALVELVADKVYGADLAIEEMLEMLSDVKVAGLYAMVANVSEADAKEQMLAIIDRISVLAGQLTVDDVVTQIVTIIAENQGATLVDDSGIAAILNALIDQLKEVIEVSVTVKPDAYEVKVKVMEQNISVIVDSKQGLTLEGVYAIAEDICAQVKAVLKDGKFTLSASAMGYKAEVAADKTAGTFNAELKVLNASEDENGETVVVEYLLASLELSCVNGKLTAKALVAGESVLVLNAEASEGSAELNIPAGESVLPLTVSWKTVNYVTTAYLSLGTGESSVVVKAVCDFSVEGKAAANISVGGFDEDVFVEQLKLLDFVAELALNDDEEVVGFVVDYELDLLSFGIKTSEWKNTEGDDKYTEYYTEFSYISQRIEILVNQEVEVDDSASETARKDALNLKKMSFAINRYGDTVKLSYIEEGAEQYYVLEITERETFRFSQSSNDVGNGTMQVVEKKIILDCVNGLPCCLQINYGIECCDWYDVSMQVNGVFQVTETVYEGSFTRKNDLWIPDESCEKNYSDSREEYLNEYVYCYYNVKTKEATVDEPHDYEVTKIEYSSDSHKCEDGVKITKTCSKCGDVYVIEANGCYYETEKIVIDTDCGEDFVYVETCVACGRKYYSMSMYSDHEYHWVNVTLTEAEIEALKEEYEGLYYVTASAQMCDKCNLIKTSYQIYVHGDEGCVRYNLEKYELIDHTTAERTFLAEMKYSYNTHYTQGYEYSWSNTDDDTKVSDETAASWVTTYNSYTGEQRTLSQLTRVNYTEYKCSGCGKITEFVMYLYFADGSYSQLNGYVEQGSAYLQKNFTTNNVENYFVDIDLTDFVGVDVSEYTGSASVRYSCSYYLESGEKMSEGYYFSGLSNQDVLQVYYYESSKWYELRDYSACKNIYAYFKEDNGNWVCVERKETEAHNWQNRCLGENCVEDGHARVCLTCGKQEDLKRYHSDKTSREDFYRDNGMYIEFISYYCCGSYYSVNITLERDVVLTENFFIAAETIVLNLNGYTLDLNGYDFVLYSYLASETNGGTITLLDAGRTNDEGESVLGKITNSLKPENGFDGLLVLCANNGDIAVGNVNGDCDTFASDKVSLQGVYDAVKAAPNYDGYELTWLKDRLTKN